jgi:hypothetical protein
MQVFILSAVLMQLVPQGSCFDWDLENGLLKIGEPVLEISGLQSLSSLLDAFVSNRDCTNDAAECQVKGFTASSEDPQCFTACLGMMKGCRSCCLDSTCFLLGTNGSDVPSCGACDLVPGMPTRCGQLDHYLLALPTSLDEDPVPNNRCHFRQREVKVYLLACIYCFACCVIWGWVLG